MIHGKAGFFIVQLHSAQTNKTYSLDCEQSLIFFKVTGACSSRWDSSVADPGRNPGGGAPPLFLNQTEARGAENIFFGDRPPLSKGLDDRPPLLQGLDPAL